MSNFDTSGIFPIQDDVEPVTTSGTPINYDLTQLLSDSMRKRPPWMSMAQVTSQVFYKYVEQQRIALGLSRNPENISRVLKIATLKMMGLEWNSDIITDDAYDRLLNTVSLYLQNHGTSDFVAYVGYALGFSLDMITLWTQDYKHWSPGPKHPAVFDHPPGPWYPTSHVGLLYEYYAKNAPSEEDLVAFTNIFYQIAPIHVVLEFIATEITGYIGPLYLGEQNYETSIDTAIAEYIPRISLVIGEVPFEKSIEIALCQPFAPDREIITKCIVYPVESGIESSVAAINGVDWSYGRGLNYSGLAITGGYIVYSSLPISLTLNLE